MKITMNYRKSTKGTHVFDQVEKDNEPLLVPTIYVRKAAFPGKTPITIELEIEVIE